MTSAPAYLIFEELIHADKIFPVFADRFVQARPVGGVEHGAACAANLKRITLKYLHKWGPVWKIGRFLVFGWLSKACGNDTLTKIAHILGNFCNWATFYSSFLVRLREWLFLHYLHLRTRADVTNLLCTESFLNNGPFPASFSLFSSFQFTVDSKQMFNISKFLPMTKFEPWTSGIGSNHSTNWATTTAHMHRILHQSFQIICGRIF